MENSHNGKRKHVRITPDNSIDKASIPEGVPRTYLSVEGIFGTEREGYYVMFVADKNVVVSSDGRKKHIDIKPVRDATTGEYLVIICRKR